MGEMATSPLPYRGSPPLQSGGQNQKWPTSGQNGYLTPAVSGIPTASKRGAKSEVAHKWARWLRHPCHLGDPHRFKAGVKIRNVQKKGGNATSPLHCGGLLAKGTKSKVAELGARTKLWMCSPKEQHQKKNHTNDVCASKNTLKTPPRTILKKRGGVQNPPPPCFCANWAMRQHAPRLRAVCARGGKASPNTSHPHNPGPSPCNPCHETTESNQMLLHLIFTDS